MKFYRVDGKIVVSEVELAIGEELTANTTDGAFEKHVPVIEQTGDSVTVRVGSIAHPMMEEHWIEWIALQTSNGNQRKKLQPGDEPEVTFLIQEGDEVEAVYAYCNLRGLWKK